MKFEKKLWPERFQKVLDGIKKSDIRLADFEVKSGDLVVLREWDPKMQDYTGRIIEKEIASVDKTKEIPAGSEEEIQKFGFQMFSFKE